MRCTQRCAGVPGFVGFAALGSAAPAQLRHAGASQLRCSGAHTGGLRGMIAICTATAGDSSYRGTLHVTCSPDRGSWRSCCLHH